MYMDMYMYSAPRHRCRFDLLFLKEHSVETIWLRVANLRASNDNSYGFIFDGFVSMETALTFDPKGFLKMTVFLTSSTVSYFY